MLLLALLLVLPADSVSGPVSGPVSGSVSGPTSVLGAQTSTHVLYHFLDPMNATQVRRAAFLRAAGRQSAGIEWIGVQRSAADGNRPAAGPDLDLQRLEDVLRSRQIHASLLAGLRRVALSWDGPDQVLLWDPVHHTSWSGAAIDAAQIVAASGLGRNLQTDVGVTTWGKVKELFR